MTWKEIIYFKPREFDSPDLPGSGTRMDLDFVAKLDEIRKHVGQPLRINSGYRTLAHNRKVGGVGGSAHTRGLAADISCPTHDLRTKVIFAAIAAGVQRIGIDDAMVHLDGDLTLPRPAIWLYP